MENPVKTHEWHTHSPKSSWKSSDASPIFWFTLNVLDHLSDFPKDGFTSVLRHHTHQPGDLFFIIQGER